MIQTPFSDREKPGAEFSLRPCHFITLPRHRGSAVNYGFTDVLTLLGSLGLFLYGMKVMSDALIELAGARMRSILATTTSNRFLAVLTGFSITAVIQSSSATTLMVVSFNGRLDLRC